MTAQRFIDFRTEDGEEGTGIGELNGRVNFFKASSIGELSWTNALNLPSAGGDWVFDTVVNGFGCIAPRTLVNVGQGYVMLSKDGLRMWDGGRRSVLDTTQGSRIISYPIKPLIDNLIKSGNYKNAVGIWYPKKSWYIFSYEDPAKFPTGKNNSVMVYDFILDQWFPFCNWLADSFSVGDNAGDTGQLYYGDAADGYVYRADLDSQTDDARKETVLDVMDSTLSWTGSMQDIVNVFEDTASLKVSIDKPAVLNAITESSMTNVSVFQIGEWYDRTKATDNDKISFKAFGFNVSSISYLRIDLEVNLGTAGFDTNYTSYTISSNSLINNGWTTFEIPRSSFPLQASWTDLGIDLIPFANTPSYYGIRFVLGGVGISSVSVDDLRFVQATQNPVKMYRFTKLFNMQTQAYKGFGGLLLTREKYADSGFFVDVYNDFGQAVRTFSVPPDLPKEIFVTGFSSRNNVTALNSIDYSVLRQTAAPESVWAFFNGVANGQNLFMNDRTNNRWVGMDRSSFTIFLSSYGAFGSGTTNFNLMAEPAMDDKYFYFCDLNNERIKQHNQTDLSFFNMTGTLGKGTTSFNDPSGIAVNNNSIIVTYLRRLDNRLTRINGLPCCPKARWGLFFKLPWTSILWRILPCKMMKNIFI